MPGRPRPGPACAALLSPGLARRFPFSAVLRTRGRVSFRPGEPANGEIANDHQSQQALGIAYRCRACCVFRRPSAGSDRRQRTRSRVEIRNGDARQVDLAEHASLEALRAPQIHPCRQFQRKQEGNVADDTDVAKVDGDGGPVPASVANANAKLVIAGNTRRQRQGDVGKSQHRSADRRGQACRQPAAADAGSGPPDQLNDLDRALQEAWPAAPTIALASDPGPAGPAAPAMAASRKGFRLGPDFLIGKIFLAFGALLTMASAARMFMA